jgi:hypothetical protein
MLELKIRPSLRAEPTRRQAEAIEALHPLKAFTNTSAASLLSKMSRSSYFAVRSCSFHAWFATSAGNAIDAV